MANRTGRCALFGTLVLALSASAALAQLPPMPTPIPYGVGEAETGVGEGSSERGAEPVPFHDRPPLVAPPNRPPIQTADTSNVACGGWFLTLEAGAISPSLNKLETSRDGATTFLSQVHSQDLNWGGVGEFDLGYRFGDGDGIGFSFRSLGSSGNKTGNDSPANLDPGFFAGFTGGIGANSGTTFSNSSAVRELLTHFDLQRADLDYLSVEYPLGSAFRVSWLGGARLVALHLDSSVTDSFSITAQPSAQDAANGAPTMIVPIALHQGATNDTAAGGVHLGLNGAWAPAKDGFGLFGKADAGILVGGSTQKYDVSAVTGLGNFPGGEGSTHGTVIVTTANLAAGIHYTMPLDRVWLRLSAGYQFEAYWFSATGSGASQHALFKQIDLIDHGPFARCEIRF